MQRVILIIFAIFLLQPLAFSQDPEIDITPEEFSFPDRQIGTTSPYQTFTIKNTGSVPVSVDPSDISVQSVNAQSTDLNIMTYNIWFDSQNWPARMNYMLSEIREKDPDIICLQEVIQRPTVQNQAQRLADSLGYFYVFASVDGPAAPTRFGNAILSRYPIVADNWKALLPLNDFRKVIHARIEIEGNLIDVYNTHLHNTGSGNQIRATQITDLKAFVASTRADDSYVFLCGDFNSNPNWVEMSLVYEDFQDIYPLFHENHLDPVHGTLNSDPSRRIDYVFFSKANSSRLQPKNAQIFLNEQSPGGIWGSDHFAVLGTFRITSDAEDFNLDNITENKILEPEEEITIKLAFSPETVGFKEITLTVFEATSNISGTGFDATIRDFPYFEPFDSLTNGMIPLGWERTHPNFGAFGAATAGGEAPEMNFWWQPVGTGKYVLSSPFIDTEGIDSFQFSMKYRVRDFGDPGLYTLKVAVVSGTDTVSIREWVDPASISPEILSEVLYKDLHHVGNGLIRLVWIFEGTTDNITQWDFDDILLEALPSLASDRGEIGFIPVEIGSSSEPQVLKISNQGGGSIIIQPEDIFIEGDDAAAFSVIKPDIEFELTGDSEQELSIIFSPENIGIHNATLVVLDKRIDLQGLGFDPTITALPWRESFDGLEGGELPLGWTASAPNWGVLNTANAGGEAPEMVFWWQPESTGQFYLISPGIETGNLDSLFFSFKYRIRDFGPPGTYNLKVVAIADGVENLITQWVNPPVINASEFTAILTRADHGLGSDDLRIAWIFDGRTDNITQWDIDDILLDRSSTLPVLELSTDAIDFGTVEQESNVVAQTVTIRNAGGGSLTLSPADLFITGDPGFSFENIANDVTLNALESVDIEIAFNPAVLGLQTATLTVSDFSVSLTARVIEASLYFVYSDFTIVEDGREFTNVGGFREVANFSRSMMTAQDEFDMGEYGNKVVKLEYDMSLAAGRIVYYMWAFPNVNLSAHNKMVIRAKADAETTVKVNLQDTDGVAGNDGGSETFVEIGTDWTLIEIEVPKMNLAEWAINAPDMSRIQKIDMEFVRDVSISENTVYIDLVGFYFDESTSVSESDWNQNTYLLFPNPAVSSVIIFGEENAEINVIDAYGKIVQRQMHRGGNTQLNISKLPSGIYFVQIQQGKNMSTKKLIKQ